MVHRIEHIAIAVKDAESSARLFETLLGVGRGQMETLPDERVKVAFFELGGSRLELVQGMRR